MVYLALIIWTSVPLYEYFLSFEDVQDMELNSL